MRSRNKHTMLDGWKPSHQAMGKLNHLFIMQSENINNSRALCAIFTRAMSFFFKKPFDNSDRRGQQSSPCVCRDGMNGPKLLEIKLYVQNVLVSSISKKKQARSVPSPPEWSFLFEILNSKGWVQEGS